MAALERMLPRNRGTIVQVGSALAYRGIPLQSAYCGAKHAIQGFTESVRTELLHDKSNVHVTMVQMPAVNTPQFAWVLSGCRGTRSRCRRSTSPRSRRGRSCTRPTTRCAASTGSAARPVGDADRRQVRAAACSTATWPAPASTRSRPTSRSDRDAPANLWEPADGPDGRDYGAHGGSTTRRRRAARSSGPPATTACSAPRQRGWSRWAPRPEAQPPSSAAADPRVGTFVPASRHVSSPRVGTFVARVGTFCTANVTSGAVPRIAHSLARTYRLARTSAVDQVEGGGDGAAAREAQPAVVAQRGAGGEARTPRARRHPGARRRCPGTGCRTGSPRAEPGPGRNTSCWNSCAVPPLTAPPTRFGSAA